MEEAPEKAVDPTTKMDWLRIRSYCGCQSWTPLEDLFTDTSLEGFGMVWGTGALAGLIPMKFEELDIRPNKNICLFPVSRPYLHIHHN